MRSCRAHLLVVSLCWLSASAAAGDWPQWGGSDGRNHVSAETGLPATFVPAKMTPSGGGIDMAKAENVKWAVRLGAYTYGNPTVANGKVFVGTDDSALRGDKRLKRTRAGMVHCFDEATGKTLWRLVVPKRTRIPKGAHYGHQHLGVCSSPTVDGDRVYVLTSATDVLCLDVAGLADGNHGPFKDEGQYLAGRGNKPVKTLPTDADIMWRYDLIGTLGVVPHDVASCSVLIHGRFLYTSTSNGVDGPHKKLVNPKAPSFVALNKMTGKLVAVDDGSIAKGLWHCQWSPPSCGEVGGRTLIFLGGGDGICYAFEAVTEARERPFVLKTAWAYDCNPPHYRTRNGKPIDYYDGDTRKKRGNKANDGTYVGPSQIIATPVFHQGRVYVPIGQDPLHGRGKGMLTCIDAATGKKVWDYDAIDRSLSTVTIADGLVYAPDVAGRVHCLDADTGKVRWVHETKEETWGSPLVADGKIYLGTKRRFHVLAQGAEPKTLAKISLGAPSYGTPVAANGVLFVASNRYIWAVAQAGK